MWEAAHRASGTAYVGACRVPQQAHVLRQLRAVALGHGRNVVRFRGQHAGHELERVDVGHLPPARKRRGDTGRPLTWASYPRQHVVAATTTHAFPTELRRHARDSVYNTGTSYVDKQQQEERRPQ